MDILNSNDNKDPMELMEQERINREKQFKEFNEQFKKQKQNSLQPSFNEDNNADFSIGRDDALIHTRVNSVNVDPLDLYRKNEEMENRMLESMTNNNISQTHNNLENNISDSLNKISKDYIVHNQPIYLEKEHFISVNSIDRDWTNTSETRYNFKVSFKSAIGVSISTDYKNVISVELINVYIPQDPIIVPFDNRLYLDALHYPYLLLEIDELDGVFRGSNTALENSFSQLIFDKEHSSQVLSNDYITDDDNGVNTNTALVYGKIKFEKQYQRGYYRFIPSFFEKKQYYNAPLSSLRAMSIKINNPDGDLLNEEIDVLTISAVSIVSVSASALEIDAAVGLPGDPVGTYIKIIMSTYFYNEQCKIGDRIKISGVTHDTVAINDYITRNKGHTIVNLEPESLTGTNNKSFIKDIYIAPPGNMKTDNSPENTVDESGAFSVSSGKLINVSLQTNLLFKVVTREVDVQSVTKPQNI